MCVARLDAVFQVISQFPNQFEFNEIFLADLHAHIESCRWGNFLMNTSAARKNAKIEEKTPSLWQFIFDQPHIKQFYCNPHYKPYRCIENTPILPLVPCADVDKMKIFLASYIRWDGFLPPLPSLAVQAFAGGFMDAHIDSKAGANLASSNPQTSASSPSRSDHSMAPPSPFKFEHSSSADSSQSSPSASAQSDAAKHSAATRAISPPPVLRKVFGASAGAVASGGSTAQSAVHAVHPPLPSRPPERPVLRHVTGGPTLSVSTNTADSTDRPSPQSRPPAAAVSPPPIDTAASSSSSSASATFSPSATSPKVRSRAGNEQPPLPPLPLRRPPFRPPVASAGETPSLVQAVTLHANLKPSTSQ
jgi:hypothetical protein